MSDTGTETARLEIRGGADDYQAAAIAAVIQRVFEEEDETRARRPARRVPPAWVRLGLATPVTRFVPPVLPDPGINWPD